MPAADDEDFDERPKRRRREEVDDDEDEEDARPRRRRRRDDDEEGDGTGGLIPYKNGKALAAYYCGVFGLVPCFFGLGIFGIVPLILGFMGLSYANKHPKASGKAHAITGIVLGIVQLLFFVAAIVYVVVVIMKQ